MSISPARSLPPAPLDSAPTSAIKRIITFSLSLFVFVACVKPAVAQPYLFTDTDTDLGHRPFWANILFFRAGEGKMTLTEVFVEIPFASITFVKTGKGYEAKVEGGAIFEDANGFQTIGDAISDTILADDFEATKSRSKTHLFYLPFQIEPGKYTLRVVVEDGHTGNQFTGACKIKVPSFHNSQLQLSSLQLARHIKFSSAESPLNKNGRLVIPNVPQIFSSNKPSCFLYFEVYNLMPMSSSTDSFQVQCRISRVGKDVRLASWNIPQSDTNVAVSLQLNFKDLIPGDYMLTVTIVDQDGEREGKAVAQFCIIHPSVML